DQLGLASEGTYDKRGLVIQTRTESRDENGNVAWLINRTVYDALGRVSVATDQYVEGSTTPVWATRYTYDDAGQNTMIEQLKGVVVDIVGTGSALMSQLTQPGTVVWSTTAQYDELNRVTQSTDRYGTITRRTYNAIGQLIETRTQ